MTREKFMDIVYSELHSDGDNYRANRIIDAADEYAEEQTRLIPCSERLPEQDRKDEAGNDVAYLVQTEWGTFFTATYDGKNWCHVDSSVLVESDVTAWMPLPTAYQSEITTGAEGGANE